MTEQFCFTRLTSLPPNCKINSEIPVPEPDLEIGGGRSSRPLDIGGGGGGRGPKKNFFGPLIGI